MVSCQKGPTRHAYVWQIGSFWQDTLEMANSNALQSTAMTALLLCYSMHTGNWSCRFICYIECAITWRIIENTLEKLIESILNYSSGGYWKMYEWAEICLLWVSNIVYCTVRFFSYAFSTVMKIKNIFITVILFMIMIKVHIFSVLETIPNAKHFN